MADIDDLLAFVRVAETGSFARAAERLAISKSIVSRRVARLEARLGARLLTRSAQGASPTLAGADYTRRLQAIFAELEAAGEAVGVAVSEIAGPVRITAPVSFGVEHLTPALARFLSLHPRIELDLVLDDRRIDIVRDHFDLAIRIGLLSDSSLVARRLAPVRAVVVASPDYLKARGRPSHPEALAGHDALSYANAGPGSEWRFRIEGRWRAVRVGSRIRVNSGDALREMAKAGLGIAVLPTFIASRAITDGSLEVVLPEWPLEEFGLHAVMPPGRSSTARVRALVDFLAAEFGPEPHWDPCWSASEGITIKS